ncbi:MAG: RimK-like protein [Gemmatimonadetes bacterium]|nr:RimK-like protein [Gemmatimonadota bacterium]
MPLAKTIRPEVLVLASRYDLSCDYVVSALRKAGHAYFRLNSEDLPSYSLRLDPCRKRLSCHTEDVRVEVDADRLVGVYFRRPTFLREASQAGRRPEEQFRRAQWAAFLRNLMIFDTARWVNHPSRTYEAEHKMIQLRSAHEVGFDVPATYCLNSEHLLGSRVSGPRVAIKGLDTVLVRSDTTEFFGYTSLIERKELEGAELKGAPLVAQQALTDKLDLRVTVVENDWWCASVTEGGSGIVGDWRLKKSNVAFSEFALPQAVGARCTELTRRLGLRFAAIDLALCADCFFFLEVNPTGEWAWLQEEVQFPIGAKLADLLGRPPSIRHGIA